MWKVLNRSILLLFIISISLSIKVFALEQIVIDSNECLDISYNEFLEKVENNEIKIIYYTKNISSIYVLDTNDNYYLTENPEYETFKKDMLEKGIVIKDREFITTTKEQEEIDKSILSTFFIFWFWSFMCKMVVKSYLYIKIKYAYKIKNLFIPHKYN